MSFLDNFDQLWKMFIRPPRQTYTMYDLGSPLIQAGQYKSKREDFELKNERNLTLQCSIFEPQNITSSNNNLEKQQKINKPNGIILYLHCFNGSRLESIKYADFFISQNISFCCFDFAGSGLSEGEYVSLGKFEQVVIKYLREKRKYEQIGIWGRSMGAVTALLYAQTDKQIKVMALDSPFTDMDKLSQEIAKQKTQLPSIILKGALAIIKSQIQKKANFEIEDINVMKNLDACTIPCLFITSKQDTLISPKHTNKIFQQYKGQKKIFYVKGDHNESREKNVLLEITQFLSKNFINCEQLSLPNKQINASQEFNNIKRIQPYNHNNPENDDKVNENLSMTPFSQKNKVFHPRTQIKDQKTPIFDKLTEQKQKLTETLENKINFQRQNNISPTFRKIIQSQNLNILNGDQDALNHSNFTQLSEIQGSNQQQSKEINQYQRQFYINKSGKNSQEQDLKYSRQPNKQINDQQNMSYKIKLPERQNLSTQQSFPKFQTNKLQIETQNTQNENQKNQKNSSISPQKYYIPSKASPLQKTQLIRKKFQRYDEKLVQSKKNNQTDSSLNHNKFKCGQKSTQNTSNLTKIEEKNEAEYHQQNNNVEFFKKDSFIQQHNSKSQYFNKGIQNNDINKSINGNLSNNYRYQENYNPTQFFKQQVQNKSQNIDLNNLPQPFNDKKSSKAHTRSNTYDFDQQDSKIFFQDEKKFSCYKDEDSSNIQSKNYRFYNKYVESQIERPKNYSLIQDNTPSLLEYNCLKDKPLLQSNIFDSFDSKFNQKGFDTNRNTNYIQHFPTKHYSESKILQTYNFNTKSNDIGKINENSQSYMLNLNLSKDNQNFLKNSQQYTTSCSQRGQKIMNSKENINNQSIKEPKLKFDQDMHKNKTNYNEQVINEETEMSSPSKSTCILQMPERFRSLTYDVEKIEEKTTDKSDRNSFQVQENYDQPIQQPNHLNNNNKKCHLTHSRNLTNNTGNQVQQRSNSSYTKKFEFKNRIPQGVKTVKICLPQ